MSIVNIISAIGNNSSVYPLIVRDCGVEVPTKILMTYNQNLKDSQQMAYNATRERFIDEYGTSLIWLGGIPAMDKLCDCGIRKLGYNPDINVSLLKGDSKQNLKLNIEKFKKTAPKEVKEMQKVFENPNAYKKLQAGKFILSTSIPVALMGYFLPTWNFALTEKIRQKQNLNQNESKKPSSQPSFKGITSTLANMSTVHKMAVTDGGLTVGRVGTARNKNEKMEMGFKMTMMMLLNFVTPIWLANGLDSLSNKLFKTNVNLDPKLLNDKKFLKSIKENTMELPKNDIIAYLDSKPQSDFAKLTEKYCGVKYLKSGVRDPRQFIDEKKIGKFKQEIEKFAVQAKNSPNPDKFAKKALAVKSANIAANVVISSLMLAAVLPKVIFILRKKITGSDAEPGLKTLSNNASNK